MSKLEFVADAAKAIVPRAEALLEEAAVLLRGGAKAADAVQISGGVKAADAVQISGGVKAADSAHISGRAVDGVVSAVRPNFDHLITRRYKLGPVEPDVPFKSLAETFGRSAPVQQSGEFELRLKGGLLKYRTGSGKAVDLEIPSLAEAQHAPMNELIDTFQRNQGALKSALGELKPGEYPKISWHGTSDIGKDFLYEKRGSFIYGSNELSHTWVHTNVKEGTAPSTYLRDIQQAINNSGGITPGGLNASGTTNRHSLVVLDASKGKWDWDADEKIWKQWLTRDQEKLMEVRVLEYLGKDGGNVGKTYHSIRPSNFNDWVLGSFDNTTRPLNPEVPRNYFDKWKYERGVVVNALEIQEASARSLNLSGVLRDRK